MKMVYRMQAIEVDNHWISIKCQKQLNDCVFFTRTPYQQQKLINTHQLVQMRVVFLLLVYIVYHVCMYERIDLFLLLGATRALSLKKTKETFFFTIDANNNIIAQFCICLQYESIVYIRSNPPLIHTFVCFVTWH